MGYDITILKPKEIDDRFVPQFNNYNEQQLEEQITDIKYDIIKMCMDEPKDTIVMKNSDLRFRIRMYVSMLGEHVRNRIANDLEKDGEVHFCGWHLVSNDDTNLESVIEWTAENLIEYRMLVRTPDFFEERENFYTKLERIKEQLDLEETVCDYVSRDFVNTYKGEYEKKWEDEEIEQDSDA